MVSSFPKMQKSSASFSQSIRNRLRLKNLQAQAKNFCRVLDIRVTEIMYASILGSDLIRDFLEVQIDPLRLQMVTYFVGEDQSFAVLRFVPPGFPRIASPLALHNLLRITDFQQVHDRLGWAQCAGLPVLGRSQLRPSVVLGTTLQLLVDDNGPVLEVHTVPCQTQRLALAQPGKEDHA